MDTYGVFGSKVMGANEVGTGSRECVAEMSWASDQDMELFGSRKDDCCQYKKVDLCCKNVLNMLCILSFFCSRFYFQFKLQAPLLPHYFTFFRPLSSILSLSSKSSLPLMFLLFCPKHCNMYRYTLLQYANAHVYHRLGRLYK